MVAARLVGLTDAGMCGVLAPEGFERAGRRRGGAGGAAVPQEEERADA